MRKLKTNCNSLGKRLMLLPLFAVLSLPLFLSSCDGIDCTINNVVSLHVGFYSSEGTELAYADTLTITAAGTDSVLLNRGIRKSAVELPMSFDAKADTLSFSFDGYVITLRVAKTNKPHFESPDCPIVVYHELEGLDFDDPLGQVDSIVIVRKSVNNEPLENIRFYFAD